jgi:hypothetical protein
MKHTESLLLGLALLPHAVLARQAHVFGCVDALEQLETLQTVAPVYRLTGGQRQREESEAVQLHVVRSPECWRSVPTSTSPIMAHRMDPDPRAAQWVR